MTRKKLSYLFFSLLCLSTLASCKNTASETSVSDTEGTVAIENTEDTSSGTIHLKVWGAPEDDKILNTCISEFQQKYNSEADLDITIEAVSESKVRDTLLADPEHAADVFTFADDQLSTFAAAGVLEPIEDSNDISTNNIEGSVSAASINDQVYAYPLTADNGYILYYNRAYLSDSDVTSLDRILEVAASHQKSFIFDMASGWYLYSFFGHTGLTLGLEDNGLKNYCTWNSTENPITGVDVFKAVSAITSNPGFRSAGDNDLIAGAKDDSVIAGVSGTWSATALEDAWGKDLGACKLPTYTCKGEQVQMASFSGYKMIGANAYSEHYSWALKLADWLSNEQNQLIRFKERRQGPSNLNASKSPDVAKSIAIQAILDQSQYAVVQRIGNSYWEAASDLGSILVTHNTEGQPPQAILDQIVKHITSQVSY